MYGYTTFHEKIMNTLINSVHDGNCSHAYIFEGESGLFIKDNADLFAAALTCLNSSIAPCGTCRSCVESKAMTNPDIYHIVREKENGKLKKTLGIEPIRNAVKDAQVRPFNAPRKVYIIDEGDLLTDDAQNAFLKTFEEPPEYAVFIIIAENSSTLLETILSRAILIKFPPVPDKDVEKYIREKYPDEDARVPFLVKYCCGIPGDADKIIANENFEELRKKSLDSLPLLLSGNMSDAFTVSDFFSQNSDDADIILDFWVSYLRDILVLQCGVQKNIINSDKMSELTKISSKSDERLTVKATDEILKTKDMLSRSVKQSAAILRCALAIKKARNI